MTRPLPPALDRALSEHRPPDHGELRGLDGVALVRWSADAVHGRPVDAAAGDTELELLDAQGVLPVQLSRGHGEHAGEDGFVGRLKAFWRGAAREAIFVELRGRRRVRLHAALAGHAQLESAAAELPELRLEGSREVAPDALFELLAVLHQRGCRFLLGASTGLAPTGRPVVDDDDADIAALPAAVWLPVPEESDWLGRTVGGLALADASIVGLARAGGAFVPGEDDVVHRGDWLLAVVARAGALASLRGLAGLGAPLRLERASLRPEPGAELLVSAGAFGPTEHDGARRPESWRFATQGDRAGLMVSVVDATGLGFETPDAAQWPHGARPAAALVDATWTPLPLDAPPPPGTTLLLLAGDRLAVAEAEALC